MYESITIGVRLSAKLDTTLVAMNSGVRSKLTSCVFSTFLVWMEWWGGFGWQREGFYGVSWVICDEDLFV